MMQRQATTMATTWEEAITTAIELNNFSLSSIANGDFQSADDDLKLAFRLCQHLLQQKGDSCCYGSTISTEGEGLLEKWLTTPLSSTTQTQNATTAAAACGVSASATHPQQLKHSPASMQCNNEQHPSHRTGSTVDNGFVCEGLISITNSLITYSISSIPMIILFNLAQTKYLYTLRSSSQNQNFFNNYNNYNNHQLVALRTAIELYEYVLDMYYNNTKRDETDEDFIDYVYPFFLLATINNLGQIYRTIGEISKSEALFQYLRSKLMYLTQYFYDNGKTQRSPIVDTKEFHDIFDSMFSSYNTFASPAA